MSSLSAYLTDMGRRLIARGPTEGLVLGDWSFQVGSGGFDPLIPTNVIEVDPSLQALLAPIGSQKPLGFLVDSGAGASVTFLGSDTLQIDGLVAIPNAVTDKHLTISGAADPNLNGTWPIIGWLSPTSVTISNPLVTISDPGPLNWQLRRSCLIKPNPSAADFHARLVEAEAVGQQLGEVGIFCRLLKAPASPIFPLPISVGQQVLFASSHFPPISKDGMMVVNFHVCVQV